MLAIDTNVLIRILARDDLKQAQIADKLTTKGAWVSHLVLAEACCVLDAVYTRTAAQLISMLELLLTHETIVLQDADTVMLALDNFRLRPSLGFSDCLVLAIAQKAGHKPLGTFDKQLAKLEGTQFFKAT
jgi:predicted nucleic-acid-binding protein